MLINWQIFSTTKICLNLWNNVAGGNILNIMNTQLTSEQMTKGSYQLGATSSNDTKYSSVEWIPSKNYRTIFIFSQMNQKKLADSFLLQVLTITSWNSFCPSEAPDLGDTSLTDKRHIGGEKSALTSVHYSYTPEGIKWSLSGFGIPLTAYVPALSKRKSSI